MEFETYNSGETKRTKRTWAIFQLDGSEDGRMVAADMLKADAEMMAEGLRALGHTVTSGQGT